MSELMRERIRQRMDELNLNISQVSRRAGLDRSILRKHLNGQVKELRDHNLKAIAQALGVEPSYLRGEAAGELLEPSTLRPQSRDVPIVGVIESEVFRPASLRARPDLGAIQNGWDPAFPDDAQVGYVVRDTAMELAGIAPEDEIVAVDPWIAGLQINDGDQVIIETDGPGDTVELTLREIRIGRTGLRLVPQSRARSYPVIELPADADLVAGERRIVAVVVRMIRHRNVRRTIQGLAQATHHVFVGTGDKVRRNITTVTALAAQLIVGATATALFSDGPQRVADLFERIFV